MLDFIYKTFLKGLVAVVPIVLTVWLILWLGIWLESSIGAGLRWMLPEGWYIPGTGLVLGCVAVFLVGLLLHAWFVQKLGHLLNALVGRIPLVKSVYGSLKDLLGFLSEMNSVDARQVVLVSDAQNTVKLLGFVTREDFTDLPELAEDDVVAVYLQMSYQMGGYTVMIPRRLIEPVDMSAEDAIRFVLTAGVTTSGRAGQQPVSAETR
jgi:uncharacterized membrane protein